MKVIPYSGHRGTKHRGYVPHEKRGTKHRGKGQNPAPKPKRGYPWPMDRDSQWYFEHPERPTHPVIRKKIQPGTRHRGAGVKKKTRYV